jgi:hypothetical protein
VLVPPAIDADDAIAVDIDAGREQGAAGEVDGEGDVVAQDAGEPGAARDLDQRHHLAQPGAVGGSGDLEPGLLRSGGRSQHGRQREARGSPAAQYRLPRRPRIWRLGPA